MGLDEFDKIYSEYYDVVFRYAVSLCGDEKFAEEITQEAFFKALKSVDKFRGDCKLGVWLCQIAKNTFLTLVKRQKQNVDYPLEAFPAVSSLEEKLIDKETAQQIHRLLHELDEPYKEVFWMRVFGELSFAEIAALFGKTESWARVTYHRAKLKIKEGMQ